MPGIAGLVGTTADAALLEPMLSRMAHKDWYVRHQWADEASGVALGRVSLGFVNSAPQPANIDGGTKRTVLDGEIYDYAAHRQALVAKGRIFHGDSQAELLLHGLEAFGTDFLRTLNGCFAAAVSDSTAAPYDW